MRAKKCCRVCKAGGAMLCVWQALDSACAAGPRHWRQGRRHQGPARVSLCFCAPYTPKGYTVVYYAHSQELYILRSFLLLVLTLFSSCSGINAAGARVESFKKPTECTFFPLCVFERAYVVCIFMRVYVCGCACLCIDAHVRGARCKQ